MNSDEIAAMQYTNTHAREVIEDLVRIVRKNPESVPKNVSDGIFVIRQVLFAQDQRLQSMHAKLRSN